MSNVSDLQVHLNLNVRGMGESATLVINEASRRLVAEGRRIYKLGLGQSPFPVPQPVVDALKLHAREKDYLPVRGLPALRESVATYFQRQQDLPCVAEDILVAPGSKELMFLLQLVYYGDLVIPTPAWVSYGPQARIVGRNVHHIPTTAEERWLLSAKALEQFCRTDPVRPRIVILNYPSNPAGTSYTHDELRALAEVARRHQMVVLSDEIYGELQYDGEHGSIARYYPEGTIVSSGLSKWCGAGGWRLGVFVFPRSLRWLQDAMAAVASETYTSTSAPIQYAAVRAFQGGNTMEGYLRTSRKVLRCLVSEAVARLRNAGAAIVDPAGSFYLFPDFTQARSQGRLKSIRGSREFAAALLEEAGVATLPGVAFGRPEEELTLRLSLVDFDGARALSGAQEKLAQGQELDIGFLDTYCAGILGALDAMTNWMAA